MDTDMPLTIDDVRAAYRGGLFPMAERADDPEFYWVHPTLRGVLPIDRLHVPAKLRRLIRQSPFEIRIDTAFTHVIDACATPQPGRPQTWINQEICDLFVALHEAGDAHSVECWQDGQLVGGLYGLAYGAVFSGESMFSRVPNASKVALVHLCARLWRGGFRILDTQFINDHLKQFGAYEIHRDVYLKKLYVAQAMHADFTLPHSTYDTEAALVETYLTHLSQKA